MSYVLVFDGDSISFGEGATNGHTLADQTLSLLLPKVVHHITAVGGRQAKECLSLFNFNVMPLYQYDKKNIIFFNAGDNDIAHGSNANETYAAIKAYTELAHHRGWQVVLSTKLQRYDWPEEARSVITNLNLLITENEAKAERVADFQANPIVGGDLGRLDRTYFTSDQIHPADAGYTILATITAAALLPLLSS